MALSTQSVTSNGTLVLLDLSIDYITRDEISVFFDSLPAPSASWAWVGNTEKKITFSPAVASGVRVLVKRTTNISKLRHEFSLGAAFISRTLDEDLKQVLHIAQEASEANFSGNFFVPINMHGNRLTEVGAGVDPSDAATVGQLGSYRTDAAASAAAAAQSVIAAAAASRLGIGTVTTGAPGTPAAVEIVGAAGGQSLNFQLPRGATGPGVPAGGSTGQMLRKVDGTDYNLAFFDITKATVGLGDVDNTSDATKRLTLVTKTSATGAAAMPAGTTGQRPVAPVYGDQRANSTLNIMEWFNGTAWVPMGGGATGAPGNAVFHENDQAVTANYTITSGKHAMSAGPITINPGITVTVPAGSVWSIV